MTHFTRVVVEGFAICSPLRFAFLSALVMKHELF